MHHPRPDPAGLPARRGWRYLPDWQRQELLWPQPGHPARQQAYWPEWFVRLVREQREPQGPVPEPGRPERQALAQLARRQLVRAGWQMPQEHWKARPMQARLVPVLRVQAVRTQAHDGMRERRQKVLSAQNQAGQTGQGRMSKQPYPLENDR